MIHSRSKFRMQVVIAMGVLPWTVVCVLLACAAGLRGSDITRPPNVIWVANEAGTGTALNKLAKLTGAPSTGIVTTAGDSQGAVGICVGGCGTAAVSAVASIAKWGNASCVFDGATTAGHYIGISTTVAGACTDAGASYPAGGQVLGTVLTTNGGGGTYAVVLWGVPGGASGSLYFPSVSTATSSVLFKGASRFLHNYADPTANGLNTFLGVGAGNFTMGPGGGAATLGSQNVGVGSTSLVSLTTGSDNLGFGTAALNRTTTGYGNSAFGTQALYWNTAGLYNVGIGFNTLLNNTDSYNVGIGESALFSNTTGNSNVAIGKGAGYTETPANANVSGIRNSWVGTESGPASAAQIDNTCGLGYRAQPVASNTCVIGNPSVTDVYHGGVGAAARSYYAPGGSAPAWGKYALLKIANGVNGCANANGCWQVNGVLGPNAAAGFTQDVPLLALPARGHVTDYRVKVGVRCTGATTALTGVGTTGSNMLYRVSNYDIDQAVADTAIATGPPTAGGSDTHAATNAVASLVTTIQNVDQLVAGCAVDYWLLWGALP